MTQFDETNTSNPKFIFRKERDFGEIITDSFSFFSQNYKTILQIFLKYVGPFVILTVLGNLYYQYKTGDIFSDISVLSGNPDYILNAFTENLIVLILFLLSAIISSVAMYAVTLHIIKSYIENKGIIKDDEVLSGLKNDFFRIIGFSILSGLAVFFGLILCVLPGIYLIVVFFIGLSIMIFEDISILDAFSRCFKLIKDNWWITFATILVFSILIAILGFIFQLPVFIYSMVETFTTVQESQGSPDALGGIYQNWVYLFLTAIGSIGEYFLSLFSIIMSALLYFNLSEKQDSRGTYDRIENIGN
jgi:hypothetical protein